MNNKTNKLTDQELEAQINSSHLDDERKKQLAELVPQMTEGERDQLVSIINESNVAGAEVEEENSEEIGKLNEEFAGKAKELAREGNKEALEEFEKLEEKETTRDLQEMESQLNQAVDAAKSTDELKGKKKHTGLKIFFFLIILTAIISGAIYGINYLETL